MSSPNGSNSASPHWNPSNISPFDRNAVHQSMTQPISNPFQSNSDATNPIRAQSTETLNSAASLSQKRQYPNPVDNDAICDPFQPTYDDRPIHPPIRRNPTNASRKRRSSIRNRAKKEKPPKIPSLHNCEIVFNHKIPLSIHCCHYMLTYFMKQLLYYREQIPMPYVDIVTKMNNDASLITTTSSSTARNKRKKSTVASKIKQKKFIEKMCEMERSLLELLENHIQKWEYLMRNNVIDYDLLIANHYLPIEINLLFGSNIRTPTQAYSLRMYLDIRDDNTTSNVKHMRSIKRTISRSFISILSPLFNTRLKITPMRIACATFIQCKANGFSIANSHFKIGHRKNKTNVITVEFFNETIQQWYKCKLESLQMNANITVSNSDMELDDNDGDSDDASDVVEIDCEMKEDNMDATKKERPNMIRHDLERMVFGFNPTMAAGSTAAAMDCCDDNPNLDRQRFENMNRSEWRIWLTSNPIKGFK